MALANKPDYNQFQAPQVDPKNVDLAKVMRWMDREFRIISASQLDKTALELRVIHAPPPDPRDGLIVHADGTSWNPGSGAGPYSYTGGAWQPLLKGPTATFATLPGAAAAGAGARAFITDSAAAPVFSAAAVGGGTLGIPVYSDGTIWRNG